MAVGARIEKVVETLLPRLPEISTLCAPAVPDGTTKVRSAPPDDVVRMPERTVCRVVEVSYQLTARVSFEEKPASVTVTVALLAPDVGLRMTDGTTAYVSDKLPPAGRPQKAHGVVSARHRRDREAFRTAASGRRGVRGDGFRARVPGDCDALIHTERFADRLRRAADFTGGDGDRAGRHDAADVENRLGDAIGVAWESGTVAVLDQAGLDGSRSDPAVRGDIEGGCARDMGRGEARAVEDVETGPDPIEARHRPGRDDARSRRGEIDVGATVAEFGERVVRIPQGAGPPNPPIRPSVSLSAETVTT